jgi:TonB-linked SusC/RagA family outer membrane protein
MTAVRSSIRSRFWLAAALLVASAGAARAQSTSITGRVVEAGAEGRPVDQVQVNVVGTTLGALTNAEGRYTIRGVPAGTHTVRALRVGYAEQKKTVEVTAGQAATADFTLSTVAVSLAPVVTTATGDQRRVEIGNSVANIRAADVVDNAPVRNIDDLLNSRTAGVAIQTGTQTGTGSRVRIRGQSSLNLSNDPIYVIDGIRMTSDVRDTRYTTGGSNVSRVGDLNPEEIENIEVVKGPSAATLYGTDAANGVIVITTKRGRAGAARWTAYGEGGALTDKNDYPWNYTIAGHSPNTTAYRECQLPQVSAGSCIKDSVRIYAPIHDKDATPVGTGNRYQAGAQVSAGTDVITYFLSAEREEETGVLQLPDFEKRRFDSTGTVIHDWTDRPNVLARNSIRANANLRIHPKLDMSIQSNFINLDERLTLESNATAGLGSHLFGGPGYKTNCLVAVTPATPCNGYRAWTPGYTWQEKNNQRVNRFIISGDFNWRPFSWNNTRLNLGNDFTDHRDVDLRLRGEAPPLTATYRDGFSGDGRADVRTTSVNASTTSSFNPTGWLNSKTTLGLNYINYASELSAAEGTTLPPGAVTPASGSQPNAASITSFRKTLGLFVDEALAFRDKLFVNLAIRSDQNSAFGTDFQSVLYPKASLSWLMTDESFIPRPGWLDQFRLRAAFGTSGVQPGVNDALRSFQATTVNVQAVEVPSVQNDRLGNKDLRPEKSEETEAGFEAKLFNSKLNIDFTWYHKRTRDALIAAVLAPSAGTGVTTLRTNLGAIRNQGFELLVNGQIIDTRAFGWDIGLNGSTNSNKLLSLGGTPPQINVSTRVLEGYPLYGWWAQPINGWEDKNHDGILTYNADPNLNEVFVGDSAIFRVYTQPRYLATWTNGFEFLNKKLRLQSLLDYRGGNKTYNNTERIRCVSRQNCNGLTNPASSFEEQAMVVATRDHPSKTLDGFYQPGWFFKLREVSVQYTLSDKLASLARARQAQLILTGRNLAKWTGYRGVDPENDYQVTDGGDVPSDFQTVGPASYFIARVSLRF